MQELLHVRFSEWFTLLMLIFTIGAPLTFLILSRRGHTTDDADCSKYTVFTAGGGGGSSPTMPAHCRPGYLNTSGSGKNVNTKWVWVTLAVGMIWLVIMLATFLSSFGFHAMRSSLPQ